MHMGLTHSNLYIHVHRVFEAKGRRDKGVIISFLMSEVCTQNKGLLMQSLTICISVGVK